MTWEKTGDWRDQRAQSNEHATPSNWMTVFGVVPHDCRTSGRPEIDTVEYERAHLSARLGGGLSHGVGGQRLTPTPSRWAFMKQTIGGGP
jgi:hypothetical protein